MEVIDLAELVPKRTPSGKDVLIANNEDKMILYTAVKGWSNGKWPKEIVVKRFVTLDALTFEGLGLWVGEGGKSKGIYFGNTSAELVNHFIEFIEKKIGLSRNLSYNKQHPQ